MYFTPQECNIKMLTNARLDKKKQPDGPKNGMIMNNTVNHCDPFTASTFYLESLLWPFSILDWSDNFNTTGFNHHSSDICTV